MERQPTFKFLGLGAVSLLAVHYQAYSQRKQLHERPNIILVLADDLGYSDIGCFGSEVSTPNIDNLASEGMRMTRFYNASRSCPSRASLLTGLYQHQAGIGDMVSNLGYPSYQGYLNKQCVTLAEALKNNGYHTYMSGKWHVGEAAESWPRNRGFDRFFGLIGGASNYFKLISYRNNQAPSRMALDDQPYSPPDSGFYMTNAITDYALQFLDEQKTKPEPFFLYLAYTAPHWPLHALPGDIAKYKGKYLEGWEKLRENRFKKMKELGIIDSQANLSPTDSSSPNWNTLPRVEKEMWDLRMAVYAAMIDRMDQNIGRILQKLKDMDENDNTVVIFLSDNGGCHEQIKNRENYIRTSGTTGNADSFDSYEYPWANASNTPFRLYKHWEYEGGISTPFVVWYPKIIKKGKINREAGHIIDVMPTLLDLANGNYPEKYQGTTILPMEGMSLVPLFQDQKKERKTPLFWEHEGSRAVRDGQWKLVSKYEVSNNKFGPWELYNMEIDRTELNDLSQQHPNVVTKLIRQYDEWAVRVGVVSREEIDKKRLANPKKAGGR